jgi:hypothetical protein
MRMQRSNMLGTASVVLLGTALVGGRIALAAVWSSAVLGIYAAKSGSKWWLLLPVSIYVVVYALAIWRNDPSWTAGGLMGW